MPQRDPSLASFHDLNSPNRPAVTSSQRHTMVSAVTALFNSWRSVKARSSAAAKPW